MLLLDHTSHLTKRLHSKNRFIRDGVNTDRIYLPINRQSGSEFHILAVRTKGCFHYHTSSSPLGIVPVSGMSCNIPKYTQNLNRYLHATAENTTRKPVPSGSQIATRPRRLSGTKTLHARPLNIQHVSILNLKKKKNLNQWVRIKEIISLQSKIICYNNFNPTKFSQRALIGR